MMIGHLKLLPSPRRTDRDGGWRGLVTGRGGRIAIVPLVTAVRLSKGIASGSSQMG